MTVTLLRNLSGHHTAQFESQKLISEGQVGGEGLLQY